MRKILREIDGTICAKIETKGTLFGCRAGDVIYCSCSRYPKCSMSENKSIVMGFENGKKMWVEYGLREYSWCGNHPNAKIQIIKRAKGTKKKK